MLNGLIYLGSIAADVHLLQPTVAWVMEQQVEASLGPSWAEAWQQLLRFVFSSLWLLPAYVVSMAVSCIWYTQIAALAFQVKQQQQQQAPAQAPQQPPQQAAAAAAADAASPFAPVQPPGVAAVVSQQAGAGRQQGLASSSLEGVAQEMYRVLFFFVFYAQITAVSFLPYVGEWRRGGGRGVLGGGRDLRVSFLP